MSRIRGATTMRMEMRKMERRRKGRRGLAGDCCQKVWSTSATAETTAAIDESVSVLDERCESE
jgi:hypothetical protein